MALKQFPPPPHVCSHPLHQALSESLKQFPEVNSSLASDGASLVQHGSHNIGIAMATPNGLVVPNIKVVLLGWGGVCVYVLAEGGGSW